MSLNDVVRAEISAELGRRRLSETQFAKMCGWKQMYLWRRLSGQTPLTVDDLAAIAHGLDVSVVTLLAESTRKAGRDEDQPGGNSTQNLAVPVRTTHTKPIIRSPKKAMTSRKATVRPGERTTRSAPARPGEGVGRPAQAHPGDGVRRPRAIGALATGAFGER